MCAAGSLDSSGPFWLPRSKLFKSGFERDGSQQCVEQFTLGLLKVTSLSTMFSGSHPTGKSWATIFLGGELGGGPGGSWGQAGDVENDV